jgi:D-hexose-6-phosphate mutarotase
MSSENLPVKNGVVRRVSLIKGVGGLIKAEVDAVASRAEIYLHGAHVTQFQRRGEPPLLFLSQLSRFERGVPIRGGIPIIFPWFGPREGKPAHGFARTSEWTLVEPPPGSDSAIKLKFRLADTAGTSDTAPFVAEYEVEVGATLGLSLSIINLSEHQVFTFEACLHTYFHIGDVHTVSVSGLHGCEYLDKCDNQARKRDTDDKIIITRETDRTYLNTGNLVEIIDPTLGRRIQIDTTGANSTVVWNPWIAKSQAMPDFGDDEYLRMICVESGNVADNRVTLPPGQTSTLRAVISTVRI